MYCSGFVAMPTQKIQYLVVPRDANTYFPFAPPPHILRRSRPASASPSAVDMDCHISVVDHNTTRPCSLVSSWLDTGEMNTLQWKNTLNIQHKDASTGRNTNTSFLVATDMHATETLNQQ